MWHAWNRTKHRVWVGRLEGKRQVGRFKLRLRIILKGILNTM
jgi:hypothetical protein